jgi:anaphase-promoting complex subunit 4
MDFLLTPLPRLPALDRCSVILSRFAGIAKFQSMNDSVGFSIQQINLITDTVACLHLVSSRILLQVVEELELFAAFSTWMRYEIDRLASETSSSTPNEESADKEASIDHSKVLLYLQACMISSPLATYFGEEDFSDWFAEAGLVLHFNDLQIELQKQEQGHDYKLPLPRVKALCKYLTLQASGIFKQIANAEKRNVLFGGPLELGSARNKTPMDMKMFNFFTTPVCIPASQSFNCIVRVFICLVNPMLLEFISEEIRQP